VTVALGSTLATILLSKDVALAEGLVAFALLISLQFIIAWLSIHVPVVRRLVKSEPTLLFYQGQMLENALNSQRVVPEEVRSAVRSQGIGQMSEVEAVILETDGSFSVVPMGDRSVATALTDVKNYPSLPDNQK
ncbi:MAG: YetF domain-containing protein, partial [Geitlerinemataceae cyanobacterium]